MLDKNDLKSMQKEAADFDSQREDLIKKSRDLLKLSKQIIYSVHRDDLKQAEKFAEQINAKFNEINGIAAKNSKLGEVGAYKVAVGEYVEAVLYYEFVKNKKIPASKELKVSVFNYLLGLCDLTGELVRKAIFLAGKDKSKEVLVIKDLVDEIYGELLKFDVRENELRKKLDSVKYDLKKLEDLVLDLKLKGKL
jgi:translin